jgi:hypothetical protein
MDRKELWKKIDEENDVICNDVFMQTGIALKSIGQLVNEHVAYEEAIPVLTEHLYRNYTSNIMEMLVRTVTTPKAKGIANKALFDLFDRQSPDAENMRNVIGSALVYTAQEKDHDRLFAIVANEANTHTVFNYIRALAKLKTNRDKTTALFVGILAHRDIEGINKRMILLETFRAFKAMKKTLPADLVEKYRSFKDRQVQKALEAVSND